MSPTSYQAAPPRVSCTNLVKLGSVSTLAQKRVDFATAPMKTSLSILLATAVDYAGLFPPSSLEMDAAVSAYSLYLSDPSSFMLGRFIVPVARLREFDDAASRVLPHGNDKPWRLSALAGPDLRADIDLVLKFNRRHSGGAELGHAEHGHADLIHAEIDSLEIRATSCAEIGAAMSTMPEGLTPFFEVPIGSDPSQLIAEIRRSGGNAKARTGGVTPDAFPMGTDVARFMIKCRDAHVAFKLTAGLHHPLRAQHRLTYAANAVVSDMFGYLNMFVAAALAWDGASEATVGKVIEERDPAAFQFADDGLTVCSHHLSIAALLDARANFVLSFGSCSFREPVDDLAELSLS